jgi:hypothetical protein
MTVSSSSRRRWVTSCLALALLTACSRSEDPGTTTTATGGPSSSTSDAPSTTGGSSAPGTSPTSSAPPTGSRSPSAAIDTYRAMWADMIHAAETSDYQSPRLAEHATSQALLLLSGSLRKAHDRKVVAKGTPVLSPQVTGGTASQVAVPILDCVDATKWLNYTTDGRLQNDTPGGKHRTTATVGWIDGRWMVTRLAIGEVGSCA